MNTITSQTFGGQILQVNLFGKDIFYCPKNLQSPPTPTRGGVPILFPQFSTFGSLTKHGFARTQKWQVLAEAEDAISANLLLTEQPDWPHRAQLNIKASIEKENRRVSIFFKVQNVGTSNFKWTGGLHPYFLVNDVLQSSLKGLLETSIYDFGMQQLSYCQQAHAIDETHAITSSLQLFSPNVNLLLEQEGYDAWQIWNPSEQHSLNDIPHDDWRRFLCVEPVVLTPKTLIVNEIWTGKFTITLLD